MENHPRIKTVLRLDQLEQCTKDGYYAKYKKSLQKTALERNLSLDTASGLTIGHFLAFTGLNRINLKNVALKIGKGWKLEGWKNPKLPRSYLEGVEAGFNNYFAGLSSEDLSDIDEFTVSRRKIKVTLGLKRDKNERM